MAARVHGAHFYGWRVVYASFVLAFFGWGLGFFGPPVFLSVIREATRLVAGARLGGGHACIFSSARSWAPTCRRCHRRFGAAAVTKAGALSMAAGIVGWATAASPWQLFVAAALSGAGWGTMSAAALNSIVSPWFVRARPAALGDGLQRRQRRRHHLLAVVGGRDRRAGISAGRGGDRHRHGR